jgi:hypothetical protein
MRYGADPSGIPTASPADDASWAAMAAPHDVFVSYRLRLACRAGSSNGLFNITMLAHIPLKSAPYSSGRHDIAIAGVHPAVIERFYLGAFAILLAGGGAVGLIALRTAIFVWRFHY